MAPELEVQATEEERERPTETTKRLRRDRVWAGRRYAAGRLMFDEAYEQGYQDALADYGLVALERELAELRAYAPIEQRREEAEARWGDYSASGSRLSDGERLAVLVEEVGEIAEAVVMAAHGGRFREGREGHADDLREEIIDAAAVLAGWLRALTGSPQERSDD